MKKLLVLFFALIFTVSVSAITISKTEQGPTSIKISGSGWASLFAAKKIYVDGVNTQNFNTFTTSAQVAEIPLTSGVHYVFAMEGDSQSNTLTVRMINYNEAIAQRFTGTTQLVSYDSNGNVTMAAEIDRTLKALVTQGELHHLVHEGKLFMGNNTLTSAGLVYYMVHAKSNTVHARFTMATSASATVVIYEGGTVSATGSTITARNQNRNYSDAHGIIDLYAQPTVTANGTRLISATVGAGGAQRIGGVEQTTEWCLKPNTTYLISITPSASADMTNGVEFYKQETYD